MGAGLARPRAAALGRGPRPIWPTTSNSTTSGNGSFFEQWLALKAYANERRMRIIGDIPIYVAMDSADAWSQPPSLPFR